MGADKELVGELPAASYANCIIARYDGNLRLISGRTVWARSPPPTHRRLATRLDLYRALPNSLAGAIIRDTSCDASGSKSPAPTEIWRGSTRPTYNLAGLPFRLLLNLPGTPFCVSFYVCPNPSVLRRLLRSVRRRPVISAAQAVVGDDSGR